MTSTTRAEAVARWVEHKFILRLSAWIMSYLFVFESWPLMPLQKFYVTCF